MGYNIKKNKRVLRGMSKSELTLFEKSTRKPKTELGKKNRKLLLEEIRRRK
jgi:hypothetical protein